MTLLNKILIKAHNEFCHAPQNELTIILNHVTIRILIIAEVQAFQVPKDYRHTSTVQLHA